VTNDAFLHRLRGLDICDLSDAIDALGLTPAVTGLVLTSGASDNGARPIAGRAVTVKIGTGPSPPGVSRHLSTAAVEAGGPDNVIVVEQFTGIDAAGWGGILSGAAQHRGIAGSIVDGLTRDVEEANKIGYPVYARGCTARTARGRIHEAGCQVPIRIGDATVMPGDYVAADRSGCVVIAAARIAEVLDRAEAILSKSDQMAAAVARGEPVSKVMGASYETMLERK
jgi:4-hydroxy-4-methyl-2-oxoglutarate aldolase